MLSRQDYHVVIRPNSKHLPEVAKGYGGIGLESEVSVVVRRRQVTALAATERQRKCGFKPNMQRPTCVKHAHWKQNQH